MQLKGKKVLIVGLGVSGFAAAKLCLAQGAIVAATDYISNPPNAKRLAKMGVRLILSKHREQDFIEAQLIIVSPGIDHRLFELTIAAMHGIPILGELELAYHFLKSPSIMITGTNGKSTVTTLVADMLTRTGFKVFSGGNLGIPLSELVLGPQKIDWTVLEVSSFQLDSIHKLQPRIGVILNITPDHLNRYDSFDDYAQSKYRLLSQQTNDDLAILCIDDPEVATRINLAPGKIWTYSIATPSCPGGWLSGNNLIIHIDQKKSNNILCLNTDKSSLLGQFNRLNLLAASLVAFACGAKSIAIQQTIDNYHGLDHRMSLVDIINGVSYYNDSKGTNIGAVWAAITSLNQKIVLLLGGQDKKTCFTDLALKLDERVSAVICFGEAAPVIHAQIKTFVQSEIVINLSQAVARAQKLAFPGEAILFSPGCASFDVYTGYAQRGDHFQTLVKRLKDKILTGKNESY